MKATIEGNELVVRIPMQEPTPSTSGRTLVVATSHGNQATTADSWQPVRPVVAFQCGKERVDVMSVKPVFVPTDKDLSYIAAARKNWVNDELQIDDAPAVSKGDDAGAWVAAWVWVTDADAGICRECGQPGANGDDSFDGLCPSCADKEEEEGEADAN